MQMKVIFKRKLNRGLPLNGKKTNRKRKGRSYYRIEASTKEQGALFPPLNGR
jgi:hypothetical protein